MNQQRNQSLTIFLGTLIISFGLFVFGIRIILNNIVTFNNLIAYVIVSTLFGAIAAFFSRFPFRAGLWIYLSGLVIGFASMLYMFTLDLSGWNDLAGLVTLFYVAAIALGLGVIVLAVQVLMARKKRDQMNSQTASKTKSHANDQN